jgi:hypothetical protein
MNPTCAVSYSADAENKQLRAIALTSAAPSLRPTDFSNAHLVSQPTQKPVGDDQLYLQVTFRYHDVYLGLLSVFNQSSDTVSCQLQWTDVLSADTTFERIEAGSALIPCEDDYCRGMCHPAAFPVQPADGGDISMYYWGTVGQHNIGVQHGYFNLAILRGFAGMRSSDTAADDDDVTKPGVLRSRPLPCSAAKLIVSADINVGASGATVCVGLFGIAGLGVADCVPVVLEAGGGGVTDHGIEWRGGKTLGALVGRKLVLEFVLTNATLWTFGFDARGDADAVSPSIKAKTDDDAPQRLVTSSAVDTEDRHEVPPLLGAAVPIWHRDGTAAEFVLFRKEFELPGAAEIQSATLAITAQASPSWHNLDPGNMPKLLGAYKVSVDGQFIAAGPGRSVNGQQGVDILDLTAHLTLRRLRSGDYSRSWHVIAVSAYHSNCSMAYKDTQTCHHFAKNATRPGGGGPELHPLWAPGADTPKLMAELRVTMASRTAARAADGTATGEVFTVQTDKTWLSLNAQLAFIGGAGPIPSGKPQTPTPGNAGNFWFWQPEENPDCRVLGGWWLPDFVASSAWSAAVTQPEFQTQLTVKATQPVFIRMAGVTLHRRGPGHYVVDCGREIQGGLMIRTPAGAATDGQTMLVGYGEELIDDFESPPRPNSTLPGCEACTVRCNPIRCSNVYVSRWTLAGGQRETFATEHEYKEFRFAELVGAPEPLRQQDVQAWVVRYPFGEEGIAPAGTASPAAALGQVGVPSGLSSFTSSSRNLDRVFALCQYTNVAASLDMSTDSNTRQRSSCHVDMLVAILNQLYALDGRTEMADNNVRLMVQSNSNIIEAGIEFKGATIHAAHAAILHGGSPETARSHFSELHMFTLLNFVNASLGLVRKPYGFVPGRFACLNGTSPCAPDMIDGPEPGPGTRDNYTFNNVSTVPNAYSSLAAERLADIAEWLGKDADAKSLRVSAAGLRASIRAKLFDNMTGVFVDGLGLKHSAVHASVAAAASGVVEDAEMADTLLAGLERRGLFKGKVLTTCWFAGVAVEALYNLARVSNDGRAAEVALQYMSRSGHRSWVAMLDDWNATMTMESWNPTDNTGGITFSHPWCSGPGHLIPRLLMGVKPLQPSWARALIQPQPGSLQHAHLSLRLGGPRGSLPSPVLRIELTQNATRFVLSVLSTLNGSMIMTRICLPPPFGVMPASCTLLRDGSGSVIESEPVGRFLCTKRDVMVSLNETIVSRSMIPGVRNLTRLKTDEGGTAGTCVTVEDCGLNSRCELKLAEHDDAEAAQVRRSRHHRTISKAAIDDEYSTNILGHLSTSQSLEILGNPSRSSEALG